MGDKVREYVDAHYINKLQIEYVEQHDRKGLAHSIYIAKETFKDEPILIILGDTIYDVDLSQILKGEYSSLGVKKLMTAAIWCREMNGKFISRLVEKPDVPLSNLAIVGLYFIKHPRLLVQSLDKLMKDEIKTKGEYQLTDALELMVQAGEKMTAFDVDGWYDCGKPETLLSTNKYLLRRYGTSVNVEGNLIIPPVSISPDAKISNSVIGPYTTIAEGVRVEDSIIRNSIVSEDAKIEKTLLDNSIIGSNASVEGRYKQINLGDSSEIDF